MNDIFISYSRKDLDKARKIATEFKRRGFSTWWDRTILPGRTFDEIIEEALDSSKCIVVLWSASSVKSNWVKAEASEALRRDILVPVLIEPTKIPIEFRRIQTAELMDWNELVSHPQFQKLIESVTVLTEKPNYVPTPSKMNLSKSHHSSPTVLESEAVWRADEESYWLYVEGECISGGERAKNSVINGDILIYDTDSEQYFLLKNCTNISDNKLRAADIINSSNATLWRADEESYWLYVEGECISGGEKTKDSVINENLLIYDKESKQYYLLKNCMSISDNKLREADIEIKH